MNTTLLRDAISLEYIHWSYNDNGNLDDNNNDDDGGDDYSNAAAAAAATAVVKTVPVTRKLANSEFFLTLKPDFKLIDDGTETQDRKGRSHLSSSTSMKQPASLYHS